MFLRFADLLNKDYSTDQKINITTNTETGVVSSSPFTHMIPSLVFQNNNFNCSCDFWFSNDCSVCSLLCYVVFFNLNNQLCVGWIFFSIVSLSFVMGKSFLSHYTVDWSAAIGFSQLHTLLFPPLSSSKNKSAVS